MKTDPKYEFPLLDTVVTGSVLFAVATFTVVVFLSSGILEVLA